MAIMIREDELLEAIAECQGERNPDAKTCIKLAAYYTILNNIREKEEHVDSFPMYSQAGPPDQVRYDSGSEFSDAIQGIYTDDLLAIMDELMDAVKVIMPRLYRATIDKIRG